MRRFFHSPLNSIGETLYLDEKGSHHLLRVVGIGPQEEVILFDGQGRSCLAILCDVQKGRAVLEIKTDITSTDNNLEEYWLLVGLVRPNPFSTILRMATELGVHHIVPILCDRSMQRSGKLERWKKIVLSASQQCGRSDVPKVYDIHELEQALTFVEHVDQKWLFHPKSVSVEQNLERPVWPIYTQAIFIGPEGGFTEKELSLIKQKKCMQKTLGNLIFRTDTAVVVALSHVLFGDK